MLENFFSAYFHEDWPCEAENPEQVVAGYVSAASANDALQLAEAIAGYPENFANDVDLEEDMFKRLGCYFSPSSEGLSAKLWLEQVVDQLRQAGK